MANDTSIESLKQFTEGCTSFPWKLNKDAREKVVCDKRSVLAGLVRYGPVLGYLIGLQMPMAEKVVDFAEQRAKRIAPNEDIQEWLKIREVFGLQLKCLFTGNFSIMRVIKNHKEIGL